MSPFYPGYWASITDQQSKDCLRSCPEGLRANGPPEMGSRSLHPNFLGVC